MNEAKIKYFQGSYEIQSEGDFVICAVSGKKILLKDLKYWNVELQEPYFSPIEIAKKFNND
ncbi:MAG: DUF2093 domain-containing protein [Pelagibacteraceae bacterium]|jgi:hypothetical protein|nr:DUF2093 domain-containing protein [Pelagibacteraceae bacterium]MCI5079579.1 DUF2093 domain-containing protein [Pelagibacteraceae bacterium]